MADILVSAMGQILASGVTFTYGIDNSGGYGKMAVNAVNGIPILDVNGHLLPTGNGTANLGVPTLRWRGLVLAKNSGFVLWDDGTGNGDNLTYPSAVGPAFFDNTTGFVLQFDVQSLAADRTIIWPNAAGTVTLLGNTSTGSGAIVLATAPTMTNPVVGTQAFGDSSTKAASTEFVAANFCGSVNETALSISAGVVNVNCALGDYFTLALSANVTSITFSNLPASGKARTIMIQTTQNASSAKTVAFPASFKWAGGVTGVVSVGLSAVDLLAISTFDQGTTWQATIGNGFA
jgi:hypothetical protein